MVRRESDDHERVDAILAQVFFEVGSNKSAVHVFAVDRFGSFRQCNCLNFIAGTIWTQETVGLCRIVNNVPDRSPARSPSCEKSGDVRFCLRIISLPQTGIEECLPVRR
jgi:hypothetical protein